MTSFSDLADRLSPALAFVEVGPEGGHARRVGGMLVLERVLWALAREGVVVAQVAASPLPLRPDVPLRVEWTAAGSAPPPGARTVRGDELEGVRVVDAATAEALERAMCRSLSKSYQGLIDAWLNWRVSSRITRRLAHTSLRPNHVTLAAAAVGLVAALCLLPGSRPAVALGGALMQLQSILDSCDGELARLRFQGSRLGQWLDNVCDDVLDNAFLVCAGVALGGGWQTLALATAGLRTLGHVIMYHEVVRRTGSGDVYSFRIWFQKDVAGVDEVFAVRDPGTYLRALGRRDTYVFVWMLLCIAGRLDLVVAYGAGLGSAIGVMMLLHLLLRPPLPPRAA
jgi:phosphatidylglycerophosphate synthase